MQQNQEDGIYQRFEIPSAEHADEAHEDVVYSIHLRGLILVSASRDKTVRIWNFDTQRLIRPPLRGHEGSVIWVQFDDSPDQDVIISGGADNSFIVWRFSTGEVLKRVEEAHTDTILSLCFDDQHLVTASRDGSIKVWNRREVEHEGRAIPPYSELRKLGDHPSPVNVVRMRENTVVSGRGKGLISLWDIRTGNMLRKFTGSTQGIACLQYSGNLIVSGSTDNKIRIFDMELPDDPTQIASLEGHSNLIRAVQVQKSGEESKLECIVSGGYDGNIMVWKPDAAQTRWTSNVTLSPSRVEAEAVNRVFGIQLDDRRIVCCTQSKFITVWESKPDEKV